LKFKIALVTSVNLDAAHLILDFFFVGFASFSHCLDNCQCRLFHTRTALHQIRRYVALSRLPQLDYSCFFLAQLFFTDQKDVAFIKTLYAISLGKHIQLKRAALIPLIALFFTAIALPAVTARVLIAQQNVPAQGHLGGGSLTTNTVNVVVFSDPQATTLCTDIDFGNLNSGNIATKTIYIKNTGNIIETLSMTVTDWSPQTGTSSLLLTWNQESAKLQAGATVPATLTLNIASDTGDISDFNFNIVISGSA